MVKMPQSHLQSPEFLRIPSGGHQAHHEATDNQHIDGDLIYKRQQETIMDRQINVAQLSFGTPVADNQRYLSMHHLQTERKKDRKAENQLTIIQLEVEDDIDGQTNGRQHEWNLNLQKKPDRAGHNISGSFDLCDSSIKSQSQRNTLTLKDMSSSRNVECQDKNSQRKLGPSYYLKNHQLYDPDDFQNINQNEGQYAKYRGQQNFGHQSANQMIKAAQNHHLAQYHYQEQPNDSPQIEICQNQAENTELLDQNQVIDLVEKESNRLSDNFQVDDNTGLRRDGLKSSFANINIHQFNELIRQQEEQQEEQTNLINQKFFKMIKSHNEVFNTTNANMQNCKSFFGPDSDYETVLSQNNKQIDNQFFSFDLKSEKPNLKPLVSESAEPVENDIIQEVSSMVRQILGHQQMMCLKHISDHRKKNKTTLSPTCIRFQNMLKRKMTDFQNYIIQNKELQNQIYLNNVKQIYKQKSGNKETKSKSMKSQNCEHPKQPSGSSITNGNNESPQQRDYEHIFSIENQTENLLDQNRVSEQDQFANQVADNAPLNIDNKKGKSKANQSSCNDSFDMLNYEIQNKIKEGQVLPQDSASQFGLKSSVKDDFDSSHGDLQVNEGYQSLKELPPYSIFANKMVGNTREQEKEKLEQSGTSLADSTNQMEQFSDKAGQSLNQGTAYNIQQCTSELSINNLDGSTQMNHSTENAANTINKSHKQPLTHINNPMVDASSHQMISDKQGIIQQQLFQQQFYNQEIMMNMNQQIGPFPQQAPSPNLSSSDDKSPGLQEHMNSQYVQHGVGVQAKPALQNQQPLVMNLGSLSHKQFKQMDKEQQRLQVAMMMRLTEQQVQAQAFAIARQQLQQRQNINMGIGSTGDCNSIDMKSNKSKRSQASSHKSKQSKKQSKQGHHQQSQQQSANKQSKQPSPSVNNQDVLNELRAQQQAAFSTLSGQQWMQQCSPMQFPNPFVPPNQYKEYIQYQQFQQFQQFQKLKEQVNLQQMQQFQQNFTKNTSQATNQTKSSSQFSQDNSLDQQFHTTVHPNLMQQQQSHNYPQQMIGMPSVGMMIQPNQATDDIGQLNQKPGMQLPQGPIPFGVQDFHQYQMQMAQHMEQQLIQYNKLQSLHGGFNGQFIPFPSSQQMESSVNSSSKLSQVSHSDTSRASQQTNRTNQTMMTNQTNLTNITSCKNVKKLNAQIQSQQHSYQKNRPNNNNNQQALDQAAKESQHSSSHQNKKGANNNQYSERNNKNTHGQSGVNQATPFKSKAQLNQKEGLPMDPKMIQPASLPLQLSDSQNNNYHKQVHKKYSSNVQKQQYPQNQNLFSMPQMMQQAQQIYAQKGIVAQNFEQQDKQVQGINNYSSIDQNMVTQQSQLRSSMQSFNNNNNLNQSQISALSSCSSNYNSRAESNSISHSVSSSNVSTSQQQRMINRVNGMQHQQPGFLAFTTGMPAQQQQSQLINGKLIQSGQNNSSVMTQQANYTMGPNGQPVIKKEPKYMQAPMLGQSQGHMQIQNLMQLGGLQLQFQTGPGKLDSQQHHQSMQNSNEQQSDHQVQQPKFGKTQKKTAAMSEFNQIYKQIQDEKDRKKFLLQNAYALSKEHQGCRMLLQKKIDEEMQRGNISFCEELLNVLIDHFNILMVDQFANYLCQKLIKIAQPPQLDRILANIKQDFVHIATDQRGTRPLQKLLSKLEPLNLERSRLLSEAIQNNVQDLSINIHGNHVVQTCLKILLTPADKEPIYETVINYSLQIARNKQGCCVMETCLKSGSAQQQKRLVNEVVKNLREFIVDEYANYVVQEVITFKDPQINFEIAKIISQNLQLYCNSKYSSKVVETLINNSNNDCQQLIYDAFMDKCNYSNKKRNAFREIMLNQYGNYAISTIIQKAFEFPNKKYIKFFLKIFKENTEQLKKINFGKKFINKIDQMVQVQQQLQAHSSTTSSGHNQSAQQQDQRQSTQSKLDKFPANSHQAKLSSDLNTNLSDFNAGTGPEGSRHGSRGSIDDAADTLKITSWQAAGGSLVQANQIKQETGTLVVGTGADQVGAKTKAQKNSLGSSEGAEDDNQEDFVGARDGIAQRNDSNEILQGQVSSMNPLVTQFNTDDIIQNPSPVQDKIGTSIEEDNDGNQ